MRFLQRDFRASTSSGPRTSTRRAAQEPNFGYRLLRALYPVFRVLSPNLVIRSNDLARAMVDVVVQKTAEPQSRIFENRDIRAAATGTEPRD